MRRDSLLAIQEDIHDCLKCSFWDLQTCARYCGGHGSDHRVMFIAESPSTRGGFGIFSPDKNFLTKGEDADGLFYKARKSVGLEDAYLTDFVKCGAANIKPDMETVNNCLGYLKREISQVRPKVIVVAMKSLEIVDGNGKKQAIDSIRFVMETLGNFLIQEFEALIPIVSTWHYSYVWNKCRLKKAEISTSDSFPIKPEKWEQYLGQHTKILEYLERERRRHGGLSLNLMQ